MRDMLEGVNVVETITRPTTPRYIMVFVAILGIFIVAYLVVICIKIGNGKKYHGLLGADSTKFAIIGDTLFTMLVIIAGFLLYDGYNMVETTYRVTVDESVSFVEFHDRYEILLEDNNEYIIREIARKGEG